MLHYYVFWSLHIAIFFKVAFLVHLKTLQHLKLKDQLLISRLSKIR